MSEHVILSYPNLRTVTLGIVTNRGAAHDNLAGTTQVLLNTMTRGTENFSESKIARLIDGKGGSLFSITEKDFAIIAAQIQPKYALQTLDLLYDIILHPKLDEKHFLIERQNLLQTLSQIESNSLQRLLMFDADKAVFGETHPLGRSHIGTVESLNQLTLDTLHSNHKLLLFNPWGFAVGAISEDIKRKISVSFRKFFNSYKVDKNQKLEISDSNVPPKNSIFSPDEEVNNSYLCINISTKVDKSNIGIARFSNALLGESFGSRMFSVLRDQRGFGYLTGASLKLLGSQLIIRCFMETNPSRTEEALTSLLEIIADLGRNPITKEEYNTTRDFILGGIDLSFDDSRTIASKLVNRSVHGIDPNIESGYEEIQSVTIEKVISWWKTILCPEKLSLAASGAIKPDIIRNFWEKQSLII
jgi:zinc protease